MTRICDKHLQKCGAVGENECQTAHPSNRDINETRDEDGRPDRKTDVDRRMCVVNPRWDGGHLSRQKALE